MSSIRKLGFAKGAWAAEKVTRVHIIICRPIAVIYEVPIVNIFSFFLVATKGLIGYGVLT